jgi:hypothetical protein
VQLKKLKAHEHYLNSKSKKREANPLGRRPTNKLHHNNYTVDNLSQNIDTVTTTTTTNNNNNNDNHTNDGSNKNNNDNIYVNDGDLNNNNNNNNNNTINNDNDNNEKGTTDDNTVSFKLDEILDETHK